MRVQRSGTTAWIRAKQGMSLEAHDTIQALAGAAVLQIEGSNATLELAAETTIRMPRAPSSPIHPVGGRMIARVAHGAEPHDELHVELPPGTLILRADSHQVEVEAVVALGEEASSIEMRKGSAAVATAAGVDIPMAPRRWTKFRGDGTVSESGASGPSTVLIAPAPGAQLQTTGMIELAWRPLSGADHYTVSLTTGTTKREIDTPTPTLATRVASGTYQWTVWGRRGEDRWPPAAASQFVVVVDNIPPQLEIVSPIDAAMISGPSVRIVGRSEPGATIEIKGHRVVVDRSGQFALAVPLERGLTNLVIKARDALGNERRLARSVLSQ